MTPNERVVWEAKVEQALAGLIGCICRIGPLVGGDDGPLMHDTLVASLALAEARALRTGDRDTAVIEFFEGRIAQLRDQDAS